MINDVQVDIGDYIQQEFVTWGEDNLGESSLGPVGRVIDFDNEYIAYKLHSDGWIHRAHHSRVKKLSEAEILIHMLER